MPRLLLLVTLLSGCTCDRSEARAPRRAEAEEPAVPGRVATEPLRPTVTRITLDQLPAPDASESARKTPEVVPPPPGATLRVPEGFVVQLFAERLPNARWLRETPDGRVLVAQSRDDRITALSDADGDGVAESRALFAGDRNELDAPFGMAFAGQHFYLGNQDEVRRYPWREGQARLEGAGERIIELPGGGYRQHWTRNVVVSPDGRRLFVSIGSRSNDDPEPEPRATVQVMDLDGSNRSGAERRHADSPEARSAGGPRSDRWNLRTFASGLRNPVGLDFQPETGALYATVNERDGLGDDLVPDYLARLEDGAFYGWPWAYLAPHLLDPRLTTGEGESARPALSARTRTPEVLFQAHSAALGLAFYDRDAFPARYRGGAFVAFRGSWNRSRGTGYKIVFVPFEGGRPTGAYEDFVTGFLIDPTVPRTWGRPVGVLVRTDGSLLFTDETGGRVYRVSYPR